MDIVLDVGSKWVAVAEGVSGLPQPALLPFMQGSLPFMLNPVLVYHVVVCWWSSLAAEYVSSDSKLILMSGALLYPPWLSCGSSRNPPAHSRYPSSVYRVGYGEKSLMP